MAGVLSPHPAFARTDHRPWPLPERPWVGRQSWRDLAFLHWPAPAAALRRFVPPGLTVQEFGGTSWVGGVPFVLTDLTLRGMPPIPGFSTFPELNVRLYVEAEGKPGVWFLSLDATNALAVWGARRFFHLPYVHARMTVARDGEAVRVTSQRHDGSARFAARYAPVAPVELAAPGTLDHWLTERYCLYARRPDGALRRLQIHHVPWPLQRGEVEIEANEMLRVHGIDADGPPLCHVARRIDIVSWTPERVVAGRNGAEGRRQG